MTDKIVCRVCSETKEKSEYHKSQNGRTICKSCAIKETNKYILDRFGSYRNANLYRKYGIIQEDYDRMYEEQKGLCYLCQRERTLVVDHNHKDGKVRKLLCSGCNTGIAQFEHDPALFDKAKEYILNE